MILRAMLVLLTSLWWAAPVPAVFSLVMRHNAEELKLSRFIFKVRSVYVTKILAEFEGKIHFLPSSSYLVSLSLSVLNHLTV